MMRGAGCCAWAGISEQRSGGRGPAIPAGSQSAHHDVLHLDEFLDAVVRAVAPRPVNVQLGLSSSALTLDDLAELGVHRVSVGSSLARAAFGGFLQAARALRQGDAGFARNAAPFAEINDLFKR